MESEPLHLLHLDSVPILQQLQIEEALLRADTKNWCLINQGAPPAIVMGISGKVEELINKNRFSAAPVTLIRRFSGGGTVFIDQNTVFVTFIINSPFLSIEPFPHSIMQWTAHFYKPVFKETAFELRENDYVIGQHKCGGNAQSICKQRWLHHSSFLWDYSTDNMDYLLLPKRIPNYREKRPHHDFLCKLKDKWEEKEHLTEEIVKRLNEMFLVKKSSIEEIQDFLGKPHRKATTEVLF